jgi:hypothetical protein
MMVIAIDPKLDAALKEHANREGGNGKMGRVRSGVAPAADPAHFHEGC